MRRPQEPIRWHKVRWDDKALDGLADGEPDEGRLPDFLIVGAAKSATTSLYYYLNQHPEIGMSIPKEPNFFLRDDFRGALHEYERCFSRAGTVRGEASVRYTFHPSLPGVAERIHSVLPHAKLIYVVRDPVDRAEAHYHQEYCSHRVGPRIEDAFADLADERNLFVSVSKYAMQTEQYLRYFPRSAFMVIDQAALRTAREQTLRAVFSFLGVDTEFASDRFSLELNTRAQKLRVSEAGMRLRRSPLADLARTVLPVKVREPVFDLARRNLTRSVPRTPLPADVRSRLEEALADDSQRFRELSGLPFDHWSL